MFSLARELEPKPTEPPIIMFDMGMMEEMANAAEMPQRGGVRGNRFLATAHLFT